LAILIIALVGACALILAMDARKSMDEKSAAAFSRVPEAFRTAIQENEEVLAASLGVIMDYHGITICPSGYITKAENICMVDSVFSIDPTYSKNPGGLIFDKKKIPYSLKLPSKYNKPGEHSISILDTEKPIRPLLEYTCFELMDIKTKAKNVVYHLKGFGNGILRFDSSVGKDCVLVKNGSSDMDFRFWKDGNSSFVQVNSKGKFTASVKRN
jgi:hypothetical protein